MLAQLTYFDGPRSDEMAAASRRGGLERIEPAMAADAVMADELIALYVLEGPDHAEVVITIVQSEEGLRRAREVIMATELLPGEDPALLPGPDRVDVYRVGHANAHASNVTSV